MNKNSKILAIVMVLSIIAGLFIKNQNINNILLIAIAILLIVTKFSNYRIRKKLEQEINNKNMTCIKARENNKIIILGSIVLIFTSLTTLKSTLSKLKIENYDSIMEIIGYINGFNYYDKFITFIFIFIYITLFIQGILILVQILFSATIITDDKVIFFDDLIFEIDQIDEIKYKEPLISKNKKIINLGKGFIDRKITIKIEDFDKVKSLLERDNIL